MLRSFVSVAIALSSSFSAIAGDTIPTDLEAAMKGFSRSMSVGGGGWEEYGSFLHDDFTRWYVGRTVLDKSSLVDSVREWWEDGTRISDARSRVVHVAIHDVLAVIRIDRFEQYTDRAGAETGSFHGFVTQVWIFEACQWKLLTLDVAPAPD